MPDVPHSNPKQFVQGSPVLHVVDVLAKELAGLLVFWVDAQ